MRKIIVTLAATTVMAIGTVPQASAQPTAEEIIRSLLPKPATRNFRGITVDGEAVEATRPSIDLQVNFAYDSNQLETDALFILDNLARALQDERLKDASFVIAGHTDAAGSKEYNQLLSERRAAAVADYLANNHRIDRSRIFSIGYGKAQLLDPARPTDRINRRVQVINGHQ